MNLLRLATVFCIAAILAVVVAVLRPVIERARDRSLVETCLERASNLGEALLSYAEINDGHLPLAFAFGEKERKYRWQQIIPYPANWNITSMPQRIQEDLCTWANATLALSKNDKNYFCPATEIIHFPGVEYRIKRPLPAAMTYTFNGLLHCYRVSEIENRGETIIGWEGIGAVTLNGYAIANPTLSCIPGLECRFGEAEARFLMPLERVATYNRSCVAVMADGRAVTLDVAKIYGGPGLDKSTSWRSVDGYPEMFSPKTGKQRSSSGRFFEILPPDTERLLPKGP